MKTLHTLLLAFSMAFLMAAPAFAGSCDHSWQTASDGSRCGDRAADVRPGGR